MKFNEAKKLHNGDEVFSKETGELIKVYEVIVHSTSDNGRPSVEIKGVGDQAGWFNWGHTEIIGIKCQKSH